MKHVKLYEQFTEQVDEARINSEKRPDLVDKYSQYKSVTVKRLYTDDDGVPAKGLSGTAGDYPALGPGKSVDVINPGTHPIVKVTLPPSWLNIGKKLAKEGLVSVYLKGAGPYDGKITATEAWFDEHIEFS
jgi:hypothetical protein